MTKKRVVVTGIGVVSPVGIGTDNFWNSLIAGKSGISQITHFDATDFAAKISGYVHDYDASKYFTTKEARQLARFIQFGSVAAREALEMADLTIKDNPDVDPNRVGVLIGSGIGSIETIEEEYKKCLEKGPSRINPLFIPKIIINEASGQVSIEHGAKGITTCVVTACSTATNAIGDAFRNIQWGEQDVMIAGGTESATTVMGVGGFAAAKALSTKRNDDPTKASRPFDGDRDGFVMGEGAGVLILESLEHAQKRGAKILGEMAGYGRTSDAFHKTAPDETGQGATRAMLEALKDAGMKPEDIDYINAHGTSTNLNDKIETFAMKNAFGDHAKKLAISSTKSMTGHLLGAAGGIEGAAALLATMNDIVPPTINQDVPDENCDLDYVPNTARQMTVNAAMSNSLGFGGHNASIIVKKFNQ